MTGTASGRVMSANFSALAHSQLRSNGSRSTALAMIAYAVFAFCVRLAMIISTVTESWSGCQQS